MYKISEPKFSEAIQRLIAVFPKLMQGARAADLLQEFYWAVADKYDLETVEKAIEHLCQNSKWTPKPADLLSACRDYAPKFKGRGDHEPTEFKILSREKVSEGYSKGMVKVRAVSTGGRNIYWYERDWTVRV